MPFRHLSRAAEASPRVNCGSINLHASVARHAESSGGARDADLQSLDGRLACMRVIEHSGENAWISSRPSLSLITCQRFRHVPPTDRRAGLVQVARNRAIVI